MEWEITERSRKCIICQKSFGIGDGYKTALFLEEKAIQEMLPENVAIPKKELNNPNHLHHLGYRFEFCHECWEKFMVEKQIEYFWEGKISERRDLTKKVRFSKDGILQLFKEYLEDSLMGLDEDQRVENNGIAYFLAIMLERKNVLVYQSDVTDEKSGARCAVYKEAKTGSIYPVKYPLLTQDSILFFQNKLNDILGISREKPEEPKEEKKE